MSTIEILGLIFGTAIVALCLLLYSQLLRIKGADYYKEASKVLNQHRHDWMNDLQMLYAYLSLGKMGKATEQIEWIKAKMLAEMKVARLGDAALVYYIQAWSFISHSVTLDVEVEEPCVVNSHTGSVIRKVLDSYQQSLEALPDGTAALLHVKLESSGKQVIMECESNGSFMDEESWVQHVQRIAHRKRNRVSHSEVDAERSYVRMIIE